MAARQALLSFGGAPESFSPPFVILDSNAGVVIDLVSSPGPPKPLSKH
jgi:hypothetical protein